VEEVVLRGLDVRFASRAPLPGSLYSLVFRLQREFCSRCGKESGMPDTNKLDNCGAAKGRLKPAAG